MANNPNPFRPRDTQKQLIMAVVTGTAVGFILVLICFAIKVNLFAALGLVLVGAFGSAALVWRRK